MDLTPEDELKMAPCYPSYQRDNTAESRCNIPWCTCRSREYKGRQDAYVDLIINEMIPAVGDEKLAEFIDVFCDTGFFTPEETARILKAGTAYGMRTQDTC